MNIKPEKKNDYRVNSEIRASQVRLVDENGNQVGVVSLTEALNKASNVGLDLVEVAATANPPVCKILDFGKFRYEENKKQKERDRLQRENAVETKELRLRPVTDAHDIQIKVQKAKEFIADGDKVLFVVRFKGREASHQDKGHEVLKTITDLLGTDAVIEKGTHTQGRDSLAILVGPPKSSAKA